MKPILIEGCEHYHINEFGVVLNTKSGKVLKPDLTNVGYHRVTLWHPDQRAIRMSIHRLVGITFIHNPEQKPWINHIDGNKLNNHVSNLEWCTCKENTIHAFKLGLRVAPDTTGIPAVNRLLTDDQVRLIRKLKLEGWKRIDIIKLVGCSINSYKNCFKYYKHVG